MTTGAVTAGVLLRRAQIVGALGVLVLSLGTYWLAVRRVYGQEEADRRTTFLLLVALRRTGVIR